VAAVRLAWLLHVAGALAPQGGAPASAAAAMAAPSSFRDVAVLAHAACADALLALSLLFPVRPWPACDHNKCILHTRWPSGCVTLASRHPRCQLTCHQCGLVCTRPLKSGCAHRRGGLADLTASQASHRTYALRAGAAAVDAAAGLGFLGARRRAGAAAGLHHPQQQPASGAPAAGLLSTPCRLATVLLLGMQPHLPTRWVACCDFLRSCLVREALQSPSMLLLFPV
jgi:hypothetical protein